MKKYAARCNWFGSKMWPMSLVFQYSTSTGKPTDYDLYPWPFDQWGVDILSPFLQAIGQRKFLTVAINYFIEWTEAKPLAQITEKKVREFLWNLVICHIGLPRVIITNNEQKFDNPKFEKFYAKLHITNKLTSSMHPWSNGEAEVHRTIL